MNNLAAIHSVSAIFAIAASVLTSSALADAVIEGDWTATAGALTENTTVNGSLVVPSGTTLDLAGHTLRVKSIGTGAGTVTSSVSGGVLAIDVDAGVTVDNDANRLTLTGGSNLQVHKYGAGTLVMTKVNTGFGANGSVSMVIKEGFAKKAKVSSATCGAAYSTIKVESGAQFDFNGDLYGSYDYNIAGEGPSGAAVKGAIVNTQTLTGNVYVNNSNGFFRNLVLSGDATVGGSAMTFVEKNMSTCGTITLGGFTLTDSVTANILQSKTVYSGNGTIVVAAGSTIGTANDLTPQAPGAEIIVRGTLSFYKSPISPVRSLVFDGGKYSMNTSATNPKTFTVNVYEWYAPNLSANVGANADQYHPHPPVNLGRAGQAATLDLSRHDSAFDSYDTKRSMALMTYASTDITVYTGAREIAVDDCLVTWNGAAPSGVTFTLSCDGAGGTAAERDLAVEARNGGLYVVSTAKPKYAVRDVANSKWTFYKETGAEIEYAWGGDLDGEIEVRFSTMAEYEALKTLSSGISPKEYVMSGFVLPAASPAATYDLRTGLAFRLASADVNGNTILLPAATIEAADAGTVTSSAEGGAIEVFVDQGVTTTIAAMEIAGGANMRLLKTGAGTLATAAENANLGGAGATSVVVRAGVLKRAAAPVAPGAFRSLGADNSVVVVENGAQVDIAGRGGYIYDYVISGEGPDGLGAIVSTSSVDANVNGGLASYGGYIQNVTLDGADATIGGTQAWGLIYPGTGNTYVQKQMNLAGRTLSVTNCTVYLGATAFTGGGEIYVRNGAVLGTGWESNLRPTAADSTVRIGAGGTLDFYQVQLIKAKSIIFEEGGIYKMRKVAGIPQSTTVTDTYAPNTAVNASSVSGYGYPGIVLGDAEHLSPVLDLSLFSAAFSAENTTFYAGSEPTVVLGSRNAKAIATSTAQNGSYLILWNGKTPAANVSFKLEAAVEARGYYLENDSTGLKLKPRPGFTIRVAESDTSVPDMTIPLDWVESNLPGTDCESDPAAVAALLQTTGANGIPFWQSYCLGLTPADEESVILCEAAEAQSAGGDIGISVKNLNVRGDSGALVTAYLQRKTTEGWSDVSSSPVSAGGVTLTGGIPAGTALCEYRVRIEIR